MAYSQQAEEEFAELQKLSNEYEPEVTGPLVGQREPSTAITTEYASADPVFRAKTEALPQKYSHYRTTRGDGRCGWRAIGFGYFETLIHLGDSNKFLEEETRLRSLSNVLNAAGFDSLLYEDFADEAFDLLRKVANALPAGNADVILHEAFNDEDLQNYIITYLKTLTSAWMKTRPSEYAPWLLGQTVDQYCDHHVMPIGSEIDNVSLSALKDVLLSSAGIALEVLYLDRTEGGEVNMHRFDPVNPQGGLTIGTIRLLYRPGHYDILYKAEDLPPAIAAIPTYLQYSSHTHNEPVYDLGVSDFMTAIPGMSYANPHQGWMSNSSYGPDLFGSSAPVQQCAPPVSTPAPPPQPQIQPQPVYLPATPTHLVAPPSQMPQQMAIRTASHATLAHPAFQPGGPFRSSAWELEDGFGQLSSSMPFQTSIFRESHFNTAHFLNPDFQPKEWRPDDDYVTTSSKSSRHRNSG
ncbi:hypothetical protein LTR36_010301 [Oleoguttula mirabilis]|uniref:ubiquitinyl hydrolase 1 n=1 Tax=Oleoguttula mirabilis TaxID=1507867 RepID=A0AAV9J4F6_9PEZI|nr:hypothetical protein LTR36_010301 [Oleoguttula mirabilis]